MEKTDSYFIYQLCLVCIEQVISEYEKKNV